MRALAYRLIPHTQPLQFCRRIHTAVPASLYASSEDNVLYRPKITRTFSPPALLSVSLVMVPDSHVRQFYEFAKLGFFFLPLPSLPPQLTNQPLPPRKAAKARHMIRGIPSITATLCDTQPAAGWTGTTVLFALDVRPFENFLPLMELCRDAGVDWAFVPSRESLAAGGREEVGVVMVVPWTVGVKEDIVKVVDSREVKKELDFREAAKKVRALFCDLKVAPG